MTRTRKDYLDQLEVPSESDNPLRASARQSGGWEGWLQFLRLVQIVGKPTH